MTGVRSRNTGKLDEIRSRLKGIDREVAQDDITRRINENNPEKPSSESSPKPEEKQTKTTENEGFLKGLQNATKDTSESTAKEKPQVDNSAKAEETTTPKDEIKVEGEPKAKTEQAQTTQEPAKEANATSGTGEATVDNMMTPEDAYNYFKNKANYKKASNVFETPSFNEYIDINTGKWIPRGYFDAYNAKDGINPKKFTFEHFKAKIPEDLGKKLTSAEATEELAKRNAALKSYDEEYKKYNSGFQAYLRKHPKLANALKWGTFGALGEGAVEFGKWLNETYMAGQNDKDELQDIRDSLNDDEPEYSTGSNSSNTNPEDITATLQGADASTETPEDELNTIQDAVEQPATKDNVKPDNTQVAANTAEPTTPVPTQSAQGLPPVVVNNPPPTNTGSSGMVYDSNKPDMVTSQLIEAMGQAPQAGSDAYGDLYDQGFIDFWAKRNPNLAFGVSQGRKA